MGEKPAGGWWSRKLWVIVLFPRPTASVADAYRWIAHDLQRQEVEARPRFRYLSLLHRHNEPTCTDADLEAERRAVRELAALLGRC